MSRPPSQAVIDPDWLDVETPMRRIIENRTCDEPGPGDSHCTDRPGHDWSCYDARGDVSFNVRQGWTHRHPGCPDDGHVVRTAAIRLDHWADELTDTDDRSKP